MKLSKTFLTALLAATLVPLAISAQNKEGSRQGKGPGGDPAERRAKLQQLDANGDGIFKGVLGEFAGRDFLLDCDLCGDIGAGNGGGAGSTVGL